MLITRKISLTILIQSCARGQISMTIVFNHKSLRTGIVYNSEDPRL